MVNISHPYTSVRDIKYKNEAKIICTFIKCRKTVPSHELWVALMTPVR